MSTVLITGSAGLIGSEAVDFFCGRGYQTVGIDNNLRRAFFGDEASTSLTRDRLRETHAGRYVHHDVDIRDDGGVRRVFETHGGEVTLIIHTAAQPSHEWAARDPYTDFTVNANGTLVMLENARRFCPEAAFIFCSTNKVYGDRPNSLPLVEENLRWEIEEDHPYYPGIDETMSIDACTHTLFGASKLAADVLVQEYGRYFGMRTAVFRSGCLTGPSHAGTQLHGFLSYLMKCTISGTPYRVLGYKGKQVRDNIHSYDLVSAFHQFHSAPRPGEVYNLGGSRLNSCSVLEAIAACEEIAGRKLKWSYEETNRIGDHIWWISDVRKFQDHYPDWKLTYTVHDILRDIYTTNSARWSLA